MSAENFERLTELANTEGACWLDWPNAYDVDAALAAVDGASAGASAP